MKNLHRKLGWLAGVMLATGSMNTAMALDIGLFGDMSIAHSNDSEEEPSFRLGSLDLYAAHHIDDKTRALFEVQFQTFSWDDITVEIQRFWVTREVSEEFIIGMGRFHTPLGYWNRHFHHGILMQDTVSRPFILSFEGSPQSILPTHLIGALAQGDLGNGIHYEAAVANSNTIYTSSQPFRSLEVPNRTDQSPNKSMYGRLHFNRFDSPFSPGIFAMRNDVLESESGANGSPEPGERLVRQGIYGLDLRYKRGRFDLMAEYYRFENDASPGVGDGGTHSADAWFAQFGYRITDSLKATYRHEGLEYDDDDPYFATGDVLLRTRDIRDENGNVVGRSGGTEQRHVFALRHDFSESNALMLEINARDPQFGESTTSAFLTWAFVMY